jgi:pyrimidine deaminase RibD-like protein
MSVRYSLAEAEAFMRIALAEGRRALPACLPNPPVGCALVRAGKVIATGCTSAPGLPHAEPVALVKLHGDLSDVAAFVTLEPCSFHQRTPSCAQELVRRGVGVVYAGILDPHPRTRGAGLQILRDAGIEVVLGILPEQAQRDMGPYLWREPLPPVTDQ